MTNHDISKELANMENLNVKTTEEHSTPKVEELKEETKNIIKTAKKEKDWNDFTVSHDAVKIAPGDTVYFELDDKQFTEEFVSYDTSNIVTKKGIHAPDPSVIKGWINGSS